MVPPTPGGIIDEGSPVPRLDGLPRGGAGGTLELPEVGIHGSLKGVGAVHGRSGRGQARKDANGTSLLLQLAEEALGGVGREGAVGL